MHTQRIRPDRPEWVACSFKPMRCPNRAISWDKGVRNGQASIEFRSYNAGAITVKATSGNLAPDSVVITVLHAPQDVVVRSRLSAVARINRGPKEMVMTAVGNTIRLPEALSGKKVVLSLFNIQDRLMYQIVPCGRIIQCRGGAHGITIIKARVIR